MLQVKTCFRSSVMILYIDNVQYDFGHMKSASYLDMVIDNQWQDIYNLLLIAWILKSVPDQAEDRAR